MLIRKTMSPKLVPHFVTMLIRLDNFDFITFEDDIYNIYLLDSRYKYHTVNVTLKGKLVLSFDEEAFEADKHKASKNEL